MRIGIDARMIGHSGIGTYLRGLLSHVTTRNNDELILFGNDVWLKKYGFNIIASLPDIYS